MSFLIHGEELKKARALANQSDGTVGGRLLWGGESDKKEARIQCNSRGVCP